MKKDDNNRADSHRGMVFFNNTNKNTLFQCQIQKLFHAHHILFFIFIIIYFQKKNNLKFITKYTNLGYLRSIR